MHFIDSLSQQLCAVILILDACMKIEFNSTLYRTMYSHLIEIHLI
jgi:hypothetical protein